VTAVLFAIYAFLFATIPVVESVATEPASPAGRVLFINSYHPDLEWAERLYDGFRSTVGPDVEVYPEFLDTKRFVKTDYHEAFLELLQAKYHDRDIDVVVVSDDAAYRLIIDRPIPFLASLPIVFCGVNEYNPTDYTDDRITGIAEVSAIDETLDAIFTLHPDLTKLIVVTDNTLNGRGHATYISDYARRNGLRERIVIPNRSGRATLDTFAEAIEDAGPGAVVYYSDYFVDPGGGEVTPEEAFARFRDAGDPPVYGHVGTYLAQGLLGGKLTLPEEQGMMAGMYTARILAGEPVDSIPVYDDGPADYVFNARLLWRYGIRRRELPANHVLVDTLRERMAVPGYFLRTAVPIVLFLLLLLTATMVIAVVRLRAARQLAYERELFQALMDESPDMIFFKDREGRFIRTNRAHDRQIGLAPEETSVGQKDDDFYPPAIVQEQRELEDRIIATGTGSRNYLEHHVSPEGHEHWMLCSKMPYRGLSGETIGIVGLSREVTGEIVAKKKLTAALEERETLLKEIHHRIKNNMQLISSILNLQKEQIRDESVRGALEEAQLRVYTMAMVHEHLYQGASMAALELGDYLSAVFLHVLGFVRSGLAIEHHVHADPMTVEPETAIHIGLVVSELLSNAVKHAFPGRTRGLIELVLIRNAETLTLTVRDDGVGFDPETAPETKTTMGMQIVTALVHQLGGTFRMYVDNGTVSEIVLPSPDGKGSSPQVPGTTVSR
jgi:PAS domain S-box-containing protein